MLSFTLREGFSVQVTQYISTHVTGSIGHGVVPKVLHTRAQDIFKTEAVADHNHKVVSLLARAGGRKLKWNPSLL